MDKYVIKEITSNNITLTFRQWEKYLGIKTYYLEKLFIKYGKQYIINFISDILNNNIVLDKQYQSKLIYILVRINNINYIYHMAEWERILHLPVGTLKSKIKKYGKDYIAKYLYDICCSIDINERIKNIKQHQWQVLRLKIIFHGMRQRTQDKKCKDYHNYGGKGIKICDEWKNDCYSFEDWAIANGYNDNLTIDRIDSSKDYCPENCHWITREQNTVKSHNILITYNNITKSLTEWDKYLGFARGRLSRVYSKHKEAGVINKIDMTLSGKAKKHMPVLITINNITKNLSDWSRYFNKYSHYFICRKKQYGLDAIIKEIIELLALQEDEES